MLIDSNITQNKIFTHNAPGSFPFGRNGDMIQLMTAQEVADCLRVTEKTIYRLLKEGKIPAIRVGNQWRFDEASISNWLRRNSVGIEV